MNKSRVLLVAVLAFLICGVTNAQAQSKYDTGATDTEIKIGQTMPYSGPASAYGTIGKTEQAFIKMINDQGGINGRKINLISLDDSFSPPKTVEQVRKLVEQDEVLFLWQNVGTAPNSAIHKYVNQKKIPHLFLATGATKWGDPKSFPWTMGGQQAFQSEAQIYARYVLKTKPDAKIAVLYQNDDFGKDLLKGLKDGLGVKGSMIVAEASYEVTDPTVDSQILSLKDSGANTMFTFATAKFAAQAIRKIYDSGWRPLHVVPYSAQSVATVLTPAGLEKSVGLITALVIKDVNDPQWDNSPDVKAFRDFMRKYYPDGDVKDANNVAGFMQSHLLVQVLKQCGNSLTRENVMRQAANLKNVALPMLLPGIKVNTSPTDFFPFEQLQLAKFDGKEWKTFGEIIDLQH
jgi:branched-chain amino acid transport system substrate-binding protein